MKVPELVGYVGVLLIVGAYLLSQIGRMDANRPLFPALNGVGACLVLYSLYYAPNPPSIVIEIFWLIISVVGLVRALRKGSSR
jgi:hypothetical protein